MNATGSKQMYNGYSAAYVSSSGARRNAVTEAADRMIGRGVLLDLPATLGVPYLSPGHAIGGDDLDRACRHHDVEIHRCDFVLSQIGARHLRARSGGRLCA
jgi:hypothetical protein